MRATCGSARLDLTSLADAGVEGIRKHGSSLIRILVLKQQLGKRKERLGAEAAAWDKPALQHEAGWKEGGRKALSTY